MCLLSFLAYFVRYKIRAMNLFYGFFRGIKAYGSAFRILRSRKFSLFFIFPALLLVLFFIGGERLAVLTGNALAEFVQQKAAVWMEGDSWIERLADTAGFLIRFLVNLLYLFLFFSFGGYFVLILMSPVYSRLSECAERELTGKTYPFDAGQMLREVCRGIVLACRNMFFQFLISFLLFLCSFIPLVGLLTPFVLFLVSAYFYGFSFIDYAAERKRFNIRKSTAYMKKNCGMVTGVGAVFAFSLLIPWVSILACCFVSLFSVVAGTVIVNEMQE